MDLVTHLTRQAAASRLTFGPGARTNGVLDHIEKEAKEVRHARDKNDIDGMAEEWVDIAILGLDGLLRAVRQRMERDANRIALERDPAYGRAKPIPHEVVAAEAVRMIVEKQGINELRDWPDWRGQSEDKAIEHVRSGDDQLRKMGETSAEKFGQ